MCRPHVEVLWHVNGYSIHLGHGCGGVQVADFMQDERTASAASLCANSYLQTPRNSQDLQRTVLRMNPLSEEDVQELQALQQHLTCSVFRAAIPARGLGFWMHRLPGQWLLQLLFKTGSWSPGPGAQSVLLPHR